MAKVKRVDKISEFNDYIASDSEVLKKCEEDFSLGLQVREEILLKVQGWLRDGISTIDIRKKLGIKGGVNDLKWKKVQSALRPMLLSDDYLLSYIGRNEHIYGELRARYEKYKIEELEYANRDDEISNVRLANLRKLLNDVLKEMRVTVQGVVNTGIDVGSISVREKDGDKKQPIVIINNIPRPSTLTGAAITDAELRGDKLISFQNGDV